MAAWLITIGLLLIGVGAYLDTVIRLRLGDAGERDVFWRGGTLDYGQYLKLCDREGWSRWPVYLIPVFILAGAGVMVFGVSGI